MTWVRLDDSFFCDPKIVEVGAEASGLYAWALAYSSHNLLDGHVPAAWVKQAVGTRAKRLSGLLVSHGLWAENGTGWEIQNYLKYNPSRAQILSKRRAESERKASGR